MAQVIDLGVSPEASWTGDAKPICAEGPFTDGELNQAAEVGAAKATP